jgi:hypothetical protein
MIKLSITISLVMFFFLSESALGQVQNISLCAGKSVRLQPSTTNAFAFSWASDPSLSSLTIKNPTATPSVSTTYTVVANIRNATNLVVNGDFELGNQDFTSQYTYYSTGSFLNGSYGIFDSPVRHNNQFSACTDHTGGIGGKMLVADGASGGNGVAKGAKVWTQTVAVTPNTNYAFSSWITNVAAGDLSSLEFSINGTPIGFPSLSTPGRCNWQEFYVVWNSGSLTTATISITEGTGGVTGSDFALDDIAFFRISQTTETIRVNIIPQTAAPVVTGALAVCLASTKSLSSSINGGVWTSNDPKVASIDALGKITPLKSGKTIINYTLNDFCNTASTPFEITVNAPIQLSPISGLTKLTIGEQAKLTINAPGGIWTSG